LLGRDWMMALYPKHLLQNSTNLFWIANLFKIFDSSVMDFDTLEIKQVHSKFRGIQLLVGAERAKRATRSTYYILVRFSTILSKLVYRAVKKLPTLVPQFHKYRDILILSTFFFLKPILRFFSI
jgi:hypothetical protein